MATYDMRQSNGGVLKSNLNEITTFGAQTNEYTPMRTGEIPTRGVGRL